MMVNIYYRGIHETNKSVMVQLILLIECITKTRMTGHHSPLTTNQH